MTERGADSSVFATSAESLFTFVMSGASSPALFYV
jgi:hypothetical protein